MRQIVESVRIKEIGVDKSCATITGIVWDKEHNRIALTLLYDDGNTDWMPASEIEGLGKPKVSWAFIIKNKQ